MSRTRSTKYRTEARRELLFFMYKRGLSQRIITEITGFSKALVSYHISQYVSNDSKSYSRAN